MSLKRSSGRRWPLIAVAAVLFATGCSSVDCGHIPAVPAHLVPVEMMGEPRSDLQELTLTRLRQDPPEVYQLGPGDVLGVYIENVLGNAEEPPAVHFPEDQSRPPAVGFPIVVREDGSVALPLVPAIPVAGLSLAQTEAAIRKAYTQDRVILKPGQDRILVTMIRRRTYRVLVVREESGGTEGVTKRGTGFAVDLPAYENDVLHALNATGGMPGTDARNEIIILRGDFAEAVERDGLVNEILNTYGPWAETERLPNDAGFTRIPLRFRPDLPPQFTQDDIILNRGDVVLIKSRDREMFYTGGVLGGGQFPLPRDYDLDVMGAIAMASGPLGSGGTAISAMQDRGSFGARGTVAGIAPSRAIVIRKTPDGGQIPIRINLNRATADPRERILVQPEDVIIVKYTLHEEVINTLLSMIRFNFLFNGFTGNSF